MGQQEIYHLLRTNPVVWFTAPEISIILGTSVDTINHNLRKMRKHNEISYRESRRKKGLNKGGRKRYEYRWK